MKSFRPARVVAVLLSICLLVLVASPPATERARAGGLLWCKADPIVLIDGRLVGITTSIPLKYLLRVNGPTQIQITTPAGVDRYVVLNDLGFNLYGSHITFVDGGVVTGDLIPVEVRVTVPMRLDPGETAPMEVLAWPDDDLPTLAAGTNWMTSVSLQIERRPLLDPD